MGRVYKALDKEINEKIAIKLIKPEIASDKNTIQRFRNELTTARKIVQKNVCRMFDLNKDKGNYYITMEYVSGGDLKQFIRRVGQIPSGRAISIAKQICEGLSEAHSLGIVHRDLKPNNIMIDDYGNARIMDFGIARTIKGKGITGSGVMIGTPDYMSPEQVEAKEIDQRSDLYSLGVIMYEMVTGRVPFEGDTALSIAMKQKTESPNNPKDYNAQIPDELSSVILKCLEKEKENRFQSAGEAKSELEKIEQGLPTTEHIAPKKKTSTSKEITVTIGLKKLLIPALTVAVLSILIIVVLKFVPQKKAVLVPKIQNSFAVISFQNLTGDNSFDYLQQAIPNLLITNLEQTGYLYVATWERMRDLLKQLGKKDVEIIEADLGFELCRLEGIQAIVLGSVIRTGNMFALDVKVLDVESKRLLKSANSQGEGVDSILKIQIDELSQAITTSLMTVSNTITEGKPKIADVSTPSLEAYRYYQEGVKEIDRYFQVAAIRNLEKALEIDPTFAMAYYYISIPYSQQQNTTKTMEALEKALSYSHIATEKEALYIQLSYADIVEGDIDKAIKINEQLVRKYPQEKAALYSLGKRYIRVGKTQDAISSFNHAKALDPTWGSVYNALGYAYISIDEFENAEKSFLKYRSLNPDDPNPPDSLGELYFMMGRLDDAIDNFELAKGLARAQNDLWSDSYIQNAYIYAIKEDYPEALRQYDEFFSYKIIPEIAWHGYGNQGRIYYHLGKYKNALRLYDEGLSISEKGDSKTFEAQAHELKAFVYAEIGDFETAQDELKTCLDIRLGSDPQNSMNWRLTFNYLSAFFDVRNEKLDKANEKLEYTKDMEPDGEEWFAEILEFWRALLVGEIALAEERTENAILAFSSLVPPKTQFVTWWLLYYYRLPVSHDGLARAYKASGDFDQSITEYLRLTTFDPKQRERFMIEPRYYFRLARIYELRQEPGRAKKYYEKFLSLWKDADPGLPEVDDAKRRLAGLMDK